MSISVICACKNRAKPLRISLSSWLLHDQIKEIIIVDWSSDEPMYEFAKIDERIKVIRVDGEKYFNQPQPLNLAAKLATSEYLLKVDCDHIFNPYFNFFESHKIQKDEFVTGFNMLVNDEFLHPLWGLLYVGKDHFEKVGGYNENMGEYYAVEDDELCVRFISLGLTAIPIKINKYTAIHIPHSDKKRVEHFESFEKIEKTLISTDDENLENKLYSRIAKISKKKNVESHPICGRMYEILGELDLEETVEINVDYYCEPIYKWDLEKISNQIYKAVKV